MKICPDCGGRGEFYTSHRFNCDTCSGSGRLTDEEFVKYQQKEQEQKEYSATVDRLKNEVCEFVRSQPRSSWATLTLKGKT